MISLMVYAVVIAGLLGLAAALAERIFADLGRARRGLWLLALSASLAVPAFSLLGSEPAAPAQDALPPLGTDLAAADLPMVGNVVRGAIDGAWLTWPDWPGWQRFDAPLTAFWYASSAAALLLLLLAALALRRSLRGARTMAVDGQQVVVADRLGPAVVGFVRPRIVLPEWLAQGERSLRGLVLRHEREHIAARDQLLLLSGLLLVASMPWNPALWWQLKRLRAAIELDCDARVVRGGADIVSYSEALLSVRLHGASVPFGAIALTEPVSELERRIHAMLEKARKISASRAAMQLTSVLVLTVAALVIDAPSAQPVRDGGASAPADLTVRTQVYEHLAEARACIGVGDAVCARAWLDQVSYMDLSDYEMAQYWVVSASLAHAQGDIAGAIDAYESVLALSNVPQGLRERTTRAISGLYAASGDYRTAFETLDEILDLGPLPSLSRPATEYLPFVKTSPVYPPAAAADGLEGEVIVEYTVTRTGTTADLEVVHSTLPIFEQAALDSAAKYKYRPRVIDGTPIDVPGVRTKIIFVLERDAG